METETFDSSKNRQERGVAGALLQPVLGAGAVVDGGPDAEDRLRKSRRIPPQCARVGGSAVVVTE